MVGQTGIALYIHNSIANITYRRQDLENDHVECIWFEVKPNMMPLRFLCVFIYRHHSASYEWFDDFVNMIYNMHTVIPPGDILLLGDFNIDLLNPHPSWDSTITLLGLTQLVKSPRITQASATLIDHIYTNNPDVLTEVDVPDLTISDYCPFPVQSLSNYQSVNIKPIHT